MPGRAWSVSLQTLAVLVAGACTPELGDAPDFELNDASSPRRPPDDAGIVEPTDAATPCAEDLQSNAQHCGRCGHDCLGGGCVDGICRPIELATDLKTPQGLAVARDALYATVYGGSAVIRVDKTTPGAPRTITSATSNPWGIGVEVDAAGNAVRVIWGEARGTSSNVLVCALPICDTPQNVAAGADVRHIAVSGDTAYWAESSTGAGKVRRCKIEDCAATAADVLPDEAAAFGIALGGAALFVGRRETPGRVRRVALDGGTATDFMTGLTGPVGIGTDETDIYVAVTGADAAIVTCPLAGACSAATFGPATNPHHVASDGVNVYWNNGLASGGSVVTCPKAGCTGGARTLAEEQGNPYTMGFDDVAVYWTNARTPGQVMKVAKP